MLKVSLGIFLLQEKRGAVRRSGDRVPFVVPARSERENFTLFEPSFPRTKGEAETGVRILIKIKILFR